VKTEKKISFGYNIIEKQTEMLIRKED